MAWQKVSPEMVEFLDGAMVAVDAERRIMFGSPCYFVNNNMFIGAHQDSLFIRLAEPDRTELLGRHADARPFEPMPGMTMREYLVIPPSVCTDEPVFEDWLQRGLRYVKTLPAKERKPRKSRVR